MLAGHDIQIIIPALRFFRLAVIVGLAQYSIQQGFLPVLIAECGKLAFALGKLAPDTLLLYPVRFLPDNMQPEIIVQLERRRRWTQPEKL